MLLDFRKIVARNATDLSESLSEREQ
jgi:hypothetical protein